MKRHPEFILCPLEDFLEYLLQSLPIDPLKFNSRKKESDTNRKYATLINRYQSGHQANNSYRPQYLQHFYDDSPMQFSLTDHGNDGNDGSDSVNSNPESVQQNVSTLKEKPKQVKRLSIETLINDSDDDMLALSSNSNHFKSNHDSVQSNTVKEPLDRTQAQNNIHIAILKGQNIQFLKGIKEAMCTPEGFNYSCSVISKWLKGLYYIPDDHLLEALVGLIDV